MAYYHLGEMIHHQAEKYKGRTALKYLSSEGKWMQMSWEELSGKIMQTARAMAELQIEPEENVGIYSQNMAKYLITDFAAYANRAVMVPMYATASPSQVEYIVNDAKIRVLFVGEQFQYNNAYKVQQECPVLEKIIVLDRNVVLKPEDKSSIYFDDFIATGDNSESLALVNARLRHLHGGDLATIIYTSGTTGEPKGVMLTHDNYVQAFIIHDARLNQISDKDLSMCFLPLTHIFEKAWTYYCLHRGITVAVNRDPTKIQETLRQIRPTLMSNVPRFWEKVYDGIQQKIEKSSGILKWLFEDSVRAGRKHNLLYKNQGKRPPIGNTLKFFLYRQTIFFLIKRVVGIDKGNFFPVAGAPLSDKINEFMQSIDVHLIYGYGLSETTATVSCFPDTGFTIGTVGKVMPEVEVKIGPDNEILVKGRTVMKGYYNEPAETAAVFTEDGFFRTGDAGRLTDNNEIVLTDRIKDLYKTSNGKYIAPQMIETRMSEDRYIDQIAVIGDERKFVSALIVPNYELLKQYALEHQLPCETNEELVGNKAVHDYLFGRIELLQAQFTSYEKIKKITLLPQPFTLESGELTNTLKLRRKIILQHYADEIGKMYEE
ncbi:AMP-dependent synthetase/ligase [Petrimonas mucosa]|jgi:long-chain acyl-CoA synthetase|uniref:Putative long-chain-fatty-acid-CoA ligase n=1 Tax=Petrimonas mucosa TaxID=1642646 RepID=A0A1G4GB26_9BACT|nr:long-chain fatty acid--CoA ligase [Petrimonas mucosa]MDD3561231.1 long-chain fatty acid--CoA ligase [Petrimonas mucosa]SCM59752.1 putative long-chain-fatty-acid-CoA ligase [Petrimonas mucosa]HHT30099.1 long-chain fatty acid--CoA ligase [Petrimonas mucosa]